MVLLETLVSMEIIQSFKKFWFFIYLLYTSVVLGTRDRKINKKCTCPSQGVWDGHEHNPIFKNEQATRTYFIAHGILLSVMWQPGWDGVLGENEYVCMYF